MWQVIQLKDLLKNFNKFWTNFKTHYIDTFINTKW
jgi:hypothetical protein